MSFFHTTKEDVERLDPLKFTEVMKKLLQANLTELKLKQSELTVSLDINDPDGGLDGLISTEVPNNHPWLPGGQSGWQFKTAKNLSVTGIVKDVQTSKSELKPEIRKLLERNGTYVFVNGGKDYNSQEKSSRIEALRSFFEEKGLSNSKVVLFSSGAISDWINCYLSVISFLKPERIHFKDIREWEKTAKAIHLPAEFVHDKNRKDIMDSIRSAIISKFDCDRATIIRIVGLSGVGKTRLIYEILNFDEFKDISLFLESPEKLPPSKLNIFTQNIDTPAIIVIDECPHEDYILLSREIEGIGGRLVLITLDYDIDKPRDSSDLHYILPPLDDEKIGDLIEIATPGLPNEAKDAIIRFAEGYPRIATLLAENFHLYPDLLSPDRLVQIGMSSLLNRLITGRAASQGDVSIIKKIMTGIALFKRLGWDDGLLTQGRVVCGYFGVNWNEARQIVEDQCQRGLVIKRGRYRYISPLPVAVYLASEWWRSMDKTSWMEFYEALPDYSSKDAFLDRITDLSYSDLTRDLIKKNLENFSFESLNNELTSSLFLKFAQADHVTAMEVLERIFRDIETKRLLEFKSGRRNIIWALEKIKWWPDTFHRAAQVLSQLAIAETETFANNATGVFTDLFKVYLGGSALPIWERFSLLEQMIDSDKENIQLLALQALSRSFGINHSSRIVGAERQGTQVVPQEWNPRSTNDIQKAIKSAFLLIDKGLQNPNLVVRKAAASIIIDSFRNLLGYGFFADLKQRFDFILDNVPEVEGEIIQAVETTLYYDSDKMPESLKQELIGFSNSLLPNDYHSLMKRYVKNRFFIDELNRDEIQQQINDLAQKSISNEKLFENEFGWLFSPNVANGHIFGRALGILDKGLGWLPMFLNQIKEATQPSIEFFGGYLFSVKEENEKAVAKTLNEFYQDLRLRKKLPELIWRTGHTEKSIEILIELINNGEMEPSDLIRFNYGAWFTRADESEVIDILECLKNKNEYFSRAINIISMYSRKQTNFLKNNKSLILGFMLDDSAFNEVTQLTYYEWDDLSGKLIEIDTELMDDFFNFLIYLPRSNQRSEESLKAIIKASLEIDPTVLWPSIKQLLLEGTTESLKLIYLIRDSNFIDIIPVELITTWLNEHPEVAPSVLAQLLPLHKAEPELHPLAKFLLLNYPEDENMMALLSVNWHTEVWMGDESKHKSRKLEMVENWLKEPELANSSWLNREKKYLRETIREAKRREEEEGY